MVRIGKYLRGVYLTDLPLALLARTRAAWYSDHSVSYPGGMHMVDFGDWSSNRTEQSEAFMWAESREQEVA